MKGAILFLFCLSLSAQVYKPPTNQVATSEMKTLADRYWRRIDGTNYWLAGLVSWEANPKNNARPLPQWQHISGIVHPRNRALLVELDRTPRPNLIVLTNYPMEKLSGERVDCYAMVRGTINFKPTSSQETTRLWFYDFGQVIAPPKEFQTDTNTVAGPAKPDLAGK